MNGTNRKKSEKNITFWIAVIGLPIGVFVTIFAWMKLDIRLFLPISILIGLLSGLITYTYLLRQDVKDKIIEVKKLNKKLRNLKDGKEKKK